MLTEIWGWWIVLLCVILIRWILRVCELSGFVICVILTQWQRFEAGEFCCFVSCWHDGFESLWALFFSVMLKENWGWWSMLLCAVLTKTERVEELLLPCARPLRVDSEGCFFWCLQPQKLKLWALAGLWAFTVALYYHDRKNGQRHGGLGELCCFESCWQELPQLRLCLSREGKQTEPVTAVPLKSGCCRKGCPSLCGWPLQEEKKCLLCWHHQWARECSTFSAHLIHMNSLGTKYCFIELVFEVKESILMKEVR